MGRRKSGTEEPASHTAIGAGTGAVLGAIGGNAGLGAIAGAGAGLVGGLIYDSVKKNEQTAYQQGNSAGAHSKPAQPQRSLPRISATSLKELSSLH
ncbi:MAG: glycine zipper family protein [Rhodopila sp.]